MSGQLLYAEILPAVAIVMLAIVALLLATAIIIAPVIKADIKANIFLILHNLYQLLHKPNPSSAAHPETNQNKNQLVSIFIMAAHPELSKCMISFISSLGD
jgi:hypothetical protein